MPVVTVDQLTDGYYVFAGTAQGSATTLTNPVFKIADGVIGLIARTSNNSHVWTYDEEVEELRSDGVNSTGMLANLITQIGWPGEGTTLEHNVQIEQDMIVAKIYPLSE